MVFLAIESPLEVGAGRLRVCRDQPVLDRSGIHDPIRPLRVVELAPQEPREPDVAVDVRRIVRDGILVPEGGGRKIELGLRAIGDQVLEARASSGVTLRPFAARPGSPRPSNAFR